MNNPTEAAAVFKQWTVDDPATTERFADFATFPFPMTEDGKCSKLTPEGLCSVYDTPEFPKICDIGLTADAIGMDRREFFFLNATQCLDEQVKAGIPEAERIKLPEFNVAP
jgi:hypothetical protein